MRPLSPVVVGLFTLACFVPTTPEASPANSFSEDDFVSQASRTVRHAYQNPGQRPPEWDPALSLAAHGLAQRAAKEGIVAATRTRNIAGEIFGAGAWDPPPRAIAIQTMPPQNLWRAVAERTDLASTPASHFGLASVTTSKLAIAVILFSNRKATLQPFPRSLPRRGQATLIGRLLPPLHNAQIWVTNPHLHAQRAPPDHFSKPERSTFRSTLHFPLEGIYTVEVVAQSATGPQVAAIFRVQVGNSPPRAPPPAITPETELPKAEVQIWKAINELRRTKGLAPLSRDSILDGIAKKHCQEMAKLGYFAHVSPLSGNATNRLKQANVRYQRVTENLGEARTALEAHWLIEDSPGHLANLLDPKVDLVGIGTARVQRGAVFNILLTEIFIKPLYSSKTQSRISKKNWRH